MSAILSPLLKPISQAWVNKSGLNEYITTTIMLQWLLYRGEQTIKTIPGGSEVRELNKLFGV